ncbi:hypothetical protein ACJX0J_041208 [Zea mays]
MSDMGSVECWCTIGNIGIGLGKNDREVSDSVLLKSESLDSSREDDIDKVGKESFGIVMGLKTRKNIAFFIALSETGKNVFSDTNSSEKNNDNFNARWPFLFNALDRILVSTEWELNGDNLASSAQPEFKDSGRWSLKFGQRSMVGQKTRKEILQKLDTLDKKAETCLLSTQEDGENTSLTADFTIDETAMNRLGVKNGVIGLGGFKKIGLSEDGMWQQILRKKYLGNKTFGQVLMFSSQKWNGSKKCISLAIDLLYLWIWGLLGCRGSIKTQRQRYIRNDVMLAGCHAFAESLESLGGVLSENPVGKKGHDQLYHLNNAGTSWPCFIHHISYLIFYFKFKIPIENTDYSPMQHSTKRHCEFMFSSVTLHFFFLQRPQDFMFTSSTMIRPWLATFSMQAHHLLGPFGNVTLFLSISGSTTNTNMVYNIQSLLKSKLLLFTF